MDYNVITREKNGGLQIIVSYKDSNGKWKQKSKQGFENSKKGEKVAKNWANDIITELKKNPTVNRQYEDITFKEFFNLFIEDRKETLRQGTLNNYKNELKRFSILNDIKLKDITTMDIQRAFNKIKDCNEVTLKGFYKRLHCIFNFAVNKYEIIYKNPVKNIEFSGNKSREKKALNSQELNDLLTKLKKLKSKNYYISSLIASKCGLRVGEILGLTWFDIDFENNSIIVRKQWVQNKEEIWDFGKLKTDNSYRTVPMPPIVIKELSEFKKSKVVNINNRLFKLTNTRAFAANICGVYRKLGFNIGIHDLRHTYATNLIANGIDFKTAAKFLGHDVSETMRTYSHVNDDMIENAKSIINKIF
jgi:integrase